MKKRSSSKPGRRNRPPVRSDPGTPRTRAPSAKKTRKTVSRDTEAKLRARLRTAEETLAGIRSGEVDALVLLRRRGERVVTLKGGEPAYRMLVEAMSEGAATISNKGALIYSNRRFAELVRISPGKIAGTRVQSLMVETDLARFEVLLAEARKGVAKGEFNLRSRQNGLVPVHLSLNRLPGHRGRALSMVITDLSEPKRRQCEEIKQTESISRLLLERALAAQEEERRRIARELHDEAGQLLTSLLVGLRALEDSRNIAAAKTTAHSLRHITAQAIDEVGRLSRGLHPVALDDHGLGVALSRYITDYNKTYHIAVEIAFSELESCRLPQTAQLGLYRILQEALTNVARHSQATSVSIRFSRCANVLDVAVTDDGHGFDAEATAASSHHMGIHSMRERATMLGGSIEFRSAREGTQVLVKVPLTQGPAEPHTGRRMV